jgi:hypothetical protein
MKLHLTLLAIISGFTVIQAQTADPVIKPKSTQTLSEREKAEQDKRARQREGMAQSKAEDEAAMKAEAREEREKRAKEREEDAKKRDQKEKRRHEKKHEKALKKTEKADAKRNIPKKIGD